MEEILQFLSNTKNVIYSCGDYKAPSIAMQVPEYKKLLYDIRTGCIKLKYITEITNENIHYCKELTKFGYEIKTNLDTSWYYNCQICHRSLLGLANIP